MLTFSPLIFLRIVIHAEMLQECDSDSPTHARAAPYIKIPDSEYTGILDSVPDKSVDQATITNKFRSDMAQLFMSHPEAKEWTILELGIWYGFTTAHFSRLFRKVIAVDESADHIRLAQKNNRNRTNIEYVQFNTLVGNWSIFDQYHINVAFIDADHEEKNVLNDISRFLTMKRKPDILIFDDYAEHPGVATAVDTCVDFDILICDTPLGKQHGWVGPHGVLHWEPEGLLCTTEKFDWIEQIRTKMQRSLGPRRRLRREVFDHSLLHRTPPDKKFDSWTMTTSVRQAIRSFFELNHPNLAPTWTVLEIGSYVGYATSVIAPLVKKVVTVDILPQFLEFNKLFNEKHRNIDYISVDTWMGNLSVLRKYDFDVVLMDGGQVWQYVLNDFNQVFAVEQVPRLSKILIFDDFGENWHVQMMLRRLMKQGLTTCEGIGKKVNSTFADLDEDKEGMRLFSFSEAMICTA